MGEFVLPSLTESTLETLLTNRLSAHDVTVRVSSAPRFLVPLGEFDTLSAEAHRGKIGDISVSELRLEGTKVKISMPTLIKNNDIVLTSANDLKLVGVITDEDLRHIIEDKIDILEDVQTSITPQTVTATAGLMIFGRKADVSLQGAVVIDRGSLIFRMTDLSVRNVLPGTFNMSSMFSNIELADKNELILGAKFTAAEMSDGKVTITAER